MACKDFSSQLPVVLPPSFFWNMPDGTKCLLLAQFITWSSLSTFLWAECKDDEGLQHCSHVGSICALYWAGSGLKSRPWD
jgi:hypothetical protein